MKPIWAAVLAVAAAGSVSAKEMATEAGPFMIRAFEPARYSQVVTDCDRLAGHPQDPNKVVPGLAREAIDLSKAIPACEAAVKADPANPRLNYALQRVLVYANRGAESVPFAKVAVEAGYPQALFVTGLVTMGGNGVPKDVCLGAELMRLSGHAGRFAGMVGFPNAVLAGDTKGCKALNQSKAEVAALLDKASKHPEGSAYLNRLLLQALGRENAKRR
jgi:hypothetical protein